MLPKGQPFHLKTNSCRKTGELVFPARVLQSLCWETGSESAWMTSYTRKSIRASSCKEAACSQTSVASCSSFGFGFQISFGFSHYLLGISFHPCLSVFICGQTLNRRINLLV